MVGGGIGWKSPNLPTPVTLLDLTPARGGKWYGSNKLINMTLHLRSEYPIRMPNFVPVYWLVFAIDAEEQEEEEDDDDDVEMAAPCLYAKHYRA